MVFLGKNGKRAQPLCRNEFCERLLSSCNPDGHRKRPMLSAEVVIGEVQRQGSFQVIPLLAEGTRQPREPLAPLAQ